MGFKESFDGIKAEERLKISAKKAVAQKLRAKAKRKAFKARAVVACSLVLFLCANRLYFTPTAEISIDINSSFEIGVNRFDKVVSVIGYNDDKAPARSLNFGFGDYKTAIDGVLANETAEEFITIAVVGENDRQCERILSNISSYKNNNAYCCRADAKEIEKARGLGLPYGKYKAFTELLETDPSVSPEQIKNMTTREIRQMANERGKNKDNKRHYGKGVRYGKNKAE